MKKIIASVIIPVRTATLYLQETITSLEEQTEKTFETIVITDQKEKIKNAKVIASQEPTPSYKRNLGAKLAKGEILAFLDDDSYPSEDWLENALKIFKEDKNIVGVCGPTLTPPKDNIYQKASGWVLTSYLGSSAAGVYRNRILPRREVEDFPSVNLLVRKKEFEKIGGFDEKHWPGEDTKLCLDLVSLKKKIIYDPTVLVYHHRRKVLKDHLKQVSRYALRRGLFAKIFPQTSFKIGYFAPSIGSYGLVLGGIISLFSPFIRYFYLLFLGVYYLLLLFSGLEVLIKERNLRLSILVIYSIFATHLVYGFLFPFGFFSTDLKTVPKNIDNKRKVYIGG